VLKPLAGMQKRVWISWAVAACVFMHAALLARHDVFMFNAALRSVDASTLGIEDFPPEAICRSEAGASDSSGKSESPPSSPGKAPSNCPVCVAFVAAYAVSPSALPAPHPPRASAHVLFPPSQSRIAEFPRFRSPPNRGPPAFAEKAQLA
jgi:hypothetical protein